MTNSVNFAENTARTFGLTGCMNCHLFKQCGGHSLPIIRALGCVNYANPERVVDTDDMNPLLKKRFSEFWEDVFGLEDYSIGRLNTISPHGLPEYITKFQNRRLKRARNLVVPMVALRLFDVVGYRKDGTYGAKYGSPSELRNCYKLAQDTKIILVGVDEDAPIESFWQEHRLPKVCESILQLGVIGVTTPNYSFFTDVPGFQILRNRKRILLAASKLSEAGVPVAPQINANSSGDWDAALMFLKGHPEVNVITMEFQTGAREKESVGDAAFQGLLGLQNKLDRRLHPILIGAARFYADAKENFDSFSIIDSQPFMQTRSRQKLVLADDGYYDWIGCPTPKGSPVDDLFENNLTLYPQKVAADTRKNKGIRRQSLDPLQSLLQL